MLLRVEDFLVPAEGIMANSRLSFTRMQGVASTGRKQNSYLALTALRQGERHCLVQAHLRPLGHHPVPLSVAQRCGKVRQRLLPLADFEWIGSEGVEFRARCPGSAQHRST